MTDKAHRRFWSKPSYGIAIGTVIGLVVASAMVLTGWGIDRPQPSPAQFSQPGDVQGFVGDWRSMVNGTWRVEQTFTRTLTDGRETTNRLGRAQRPPDSVSVSSGSITVSQRGTRRVCPTPTAGATPVCRSGGTYDSAAEAAAQVDAVTAAVSGPGATYSVIERHDECFELRPTSAGLRQPIDALAWGTEAVFCFDTKTTALVSSRITREGGVDVVAATLITGTVTDDDLNRLATDG